MKRFLSTLLSVTLLAGLLAGCGSKDNGSSGGAMGRYVEEQGQTLEHINSVSDFRRLDNGDLTFYANTDTAGIEQVVIPADGSPAQRTALDSFDGLNATNFSLGANGTLYFLSVDTNGKYHVMRSVDGGTPEYVDIPDLPPINAPEAEADSEVAMSGGMTSMSGGGSFISTANQKYPTGVVALSDGFLVLFGSAGASRYNYEGALQAEFPGIAVRGNVVVQGSTLLMPNADNTALVSYDLEAGKQLDTYVYEGLDFYSKVGMDTDGVYLANTSGIYRQPSGGSLWEKLVDGGLTTLVMPNVSVAGLTTDGGTGFYALLSLDKSNYQLMHYFFDAETPTIPDTELTVFSLRDSSTVRQTIGEFQRRNPNVRVNFRVALGDDAAATATAEDVIRALNTEILNGKGPDILLLDGLPVDSYVEKNVLLDLSDLAGGDSGLMSNLLGAYQRDGKIYGIPARFTFPVMMGSADAVDAVSSLTSLLSKTANNGDNTVPFLLAPTSLWDEEGTGLLMQYYDACSSAFFKDGAVDEAALTEYFTTMLALDGAVKAYTPENGAMGMTMAVMSISSSGGYEPLDMGPYRLKDGAAQFHIGQMLGVMGLKSLSEQLASLDNQKINTMFGGGQYTPCVSVGVLASGKQQELAKSFVELMLSSSVQDKYLYDGYPVNGASLDKMVNETLTQKDGTKGSDMGFLALCDTLSTPILVDQVVKDAVQAQVSGLLDGSLTPAQAAANVVEKTQLYLAE